MQGAESAAWIQPTCRTTSLCDLHTTHASRCRYPVLPTSSRVNAYRYATKQSLHVAGRLASEPRRVRKPSRYTYGKIIEASRYEKAFQPYAPASFSSLFVLASVCVIVAACAVVLELAIMAALDIFTPDHAIVDKTSPSSDEGIPSRFDAGQEGEITCAPVNSSRVC